MIRSALLLSSVALLVPTLAHAEDLTARSIVATIANRSDDRLNDSRIVCAFGELGTADARGQARYGNDPRDAATFCPAIIAEAIKRGNEADLYTSMQSEHAALELQLIVVASAKGQDRYLNARGQETQLTCELAFDAGYIYGHTNPGTTILNNLTTTQINGQIAQCFDRGSDLPTSDAFWTGARLAQKHLSGAG